MRLTVLSIAFPFAPVSPDAVGGAEQILSDIDQALVAAGHTSLVIACEGSYPAGKLFPTPLPRTESVTAQEKLWCTKRTGAVIDRVLRTNAVDLVHIHGMDFYKYELPASVPVLVTLHVPINWYPADIWSKFGPNVHFCCVSESQRRTVPPELDEACVIENGVDVPPPPNISRGDFALVLGRICPEKNAHAALEAGTLANTMVLLAGQIFPYPEHQQYYDERIAPLLQPSSSTVRHEFLGPLSHTRKQELLSQAKCLLHPTLAAETSSLVAMEALASGTPVIAYRSGALPDIIEDGVTGFLVNGVDEMAQAIRRVHTLSPQACHNAAARRFSKEHMLRRYFELYESLVYQTQPQRSYA